MTEALPDCGIYRAGRDLPGHEEQITAGSLIYFHNHSEQGPPLVLLPHENTHNRWTFHKTGWLVEDPAFIAELVPLKPQGFYLVTGNHLHLAREEVLPEKSLVQLGYNRRGDSILFPAKFEGLTITFPTRGYRFESPDVQKRLTPAGFVAPVPQNKRVLH